MNPVYIKWSEHEHQSKFIFEARKILRPLGLRNLLYAVPNGGVRGGYKLKSGRFVSHAEAGSSLKKEGVVPGMPDVNLDYPVGRYHGLRIEMKKYGGKPSDEQLEIIADLRKQGFRVEICIGWEEALGVFKDYLKNDV